MSVYSTFPLNYWLQHTAHSKTVISFPVSKQAVLQEHRFSLQTLCLPFCSPSPERGADKVKIYLVGLWAQRWQQVSTAPRWDSTAMCCSLFRIKPQHASSTLMQFQSTCVPSQWCCYRKASLKFTDCSSSAGSSNGSRIQALICLGYTLNN